MKDQRQKNVVLKVNLALATPATYPVTAWISLYGLSEQAVACLPALIKTAAYLC